MNLMLFMGKVPKAANLTYEDALEYRQQILYLLWTQCLTFLLYALTLAFGVVVLWQSSLSDNASNELYRVIFQALFVGSFSAAFVRSIVLPYQLADLHGFTLDRYVEGVKRERNSAIAARIAEIDGTDEK